MGDLRDSESEGFGWCTDGESELYSEVPRGPSETSVAEPDYEDVERTMSHADDTSSMSSAELVPVPSIAVETVSRRSGTRTPTKEPVPHPDVPPTGWFFGGERPRRSPSENAELLRHLVNMTNQTNQLLKSLIALTKKSQKEVCDELCEVKRHTRQRP